MVIHQFIRWLGNNQTKGTETSKLEISLNFFKTIKFKVMKTIRNQLKYPVDLQIPMLL